MCRAITLMLAIIFSQGCTSMLDKMAVENAKNTYLYKGKILAITNAKAEIHHFSPESSFSIGVRSAIISNSLVVGVIANMLVRDAKKDEIVESYIVELTDGSNLTIPRENRSYVANDCIEFIMFQEIGVGFSKRGRLEIVKTDCNKLTTKAL